MLLPCTSTSSHPVSSGAGSTSAHGTSARLTYRRRNRSVNGQRHWYVWSATHAWPVIRGGCPSTAKLSGTKPSHQSPSSREAWIRSSSPHARYSRWVQNSLSVTQASQGHSVSPIGPIGGSTPAGDNVVHPAAHLVDARALDVQLATDAALPLALRVAGPARRSGGALRGRGPWMGSGMLGPAVRPHADSTGVVVASVVVGSTTEVTEVHRGSKEGWQPAVRAPPRRRS